MCRSMRRHAQGVGICSPGDFFVKVTSVIASGGFKIIHSEKLITFSPLLCGC